VSGTIDSIDPEEQAELLGDFYQTVESVIADLDGTVVTSTGYDMLVCFGYPMGYEHSAQSAVRTGLGMLEAAAELNRTMASQRNEVAGTQSASSWLLRTTMSQARLWRSNGKETEALAALEAASGAFEEGLDTPDLLDAKALIAELS